VKKGDGLAVFVNSVTGQEYEYELKGVGDCITFYGKEGVFVYKMVKSSKREAKKKGVTRNNV